MSPADPGIGLEIADGAGTTPSGGTPPMRSLRDLPLNSLVVRPDQTVRVALGLMEANRETAVAVLNGGKAIGLITWEAALLADPDEPVTAAMRGLDNVVDIAQSVQNVAKAIVERRLDHAAVVDGGRFRGVVSSIALLGELQHSWDPMTNLPWSDRLRDWGAAMLEEDREISILFFDIDDFGKYNKVHGHKIGDDVIKALARFLEAAVDPRTDVVVRYAGDEFAIGTLRDRGDSEAFTASLEPMTLQVQGLPGEVAFSAGISGGKRTTKPSRTREEADVHVQSTLDNLITLASRACTANKNKKKSGRIAETVLHLVEATVQIGDQARANVVLSENGRTVTGGAEAPARKHLRAVALAAAQAIEVLHPESTVQIDDVVMHRSVEGEEQVSVLGHLERGMLCLSFSGSHPTGPDIGVSVALAVCQGYGSVA